MKHAIHHQKMPMRQPEMAKVTTSHINPPPSIHKAKEILKHGEVRGHALSEKQKKLFGFIAGGGRPTRLKK